MGKEVEVKILGNKYSFETDRDSNDALKIAMYVDEIMRETKNESPYESDITIAIIAALNIADKLYELESRLEELEKYVEE